MERIAVIIPTLRRPQALETAVRSVFNQTRLPDEIVVADNDPEGSARELVARLADAAPFPIIYVHAPRPGVATARNAALGATDVGVIAFLDDDEVASPRWLEALLSAQEQLGSDITFGPIQGRAPSAPVWMRPYLERFFSRSGPDANTRIEDSHGCGNSLFVRNRTLIGPAPFDVATDQSGGEDDTLFEKLSEQGIGFGWAADAWVDEAAPAHRATLRYTLTRAFAYGQGPSQRAARNRDWPGLLRWMAIGAGQAGIYGLIAGVNWIIGAAARADWTDRALRGLGKLFWMKPFEPKFYGATELRRAQRTG